MSCSSHGYWGNGCCPTCSPANVAIRGACTDPGTITSARFLLGLDNQFCEGRIVNNAGLLSNELNGSGNSSIAWRQSPKIDPESITIAESISFGNLLIIGTDSRLHQIQVPNTPNLILKTNGSGNLVLSSIPEAAVPDPLNINDLNVSDQAVIDKLEVNNTFEVNNLSTGTAVNLLALNASNEVILQGLAQGLSVSMFFESPTSPNAAEPNKLKTNGSYLVIGNRLFDSGQDNITVATSESLQVQDAGTYVIIWTAQGRTSGANSAYGAFLEINGTVVNEGNARTNLTGSLGTAAPQMYTVMGIDVRTYAANDVIKLLLSTSAASSITASVRLVAIRIP